MKNIGLSEGGILLLDAETLPFFVIPINCIGIPYAEGVHFGCVIAVIYF